MLVATEDTLPGGSRRGDRLRPPPPGEPATKRVNPGAKITGVLKSAGDQLSSAVDDLGKQLTKRPSKKAPAAEDEKAAAASE